jgi:class 3 adenylate cyclase/tetratricopeptide (TPR) repeat protein
VSETWSSPTEVGDRRVVTALFADLSGFTSLAEQLDPEDLTNLINECFSGLAEAVRLRGGWVEKQVGDALVVFFGAPVVHEDDPVRAVHAALAMRESMREHNERLGPRLGRQLDLHIGVNTGLVVMDRGLETGVGGEMVVLGDTVNVAARLQQVARAGQILVGESTYAATSSAFDFRKLPPLTVKGKSEPLTAYECLRARKRWVRAEDRMARVDSPLVGRDADLAALSGSIERLRAGQGGILTVIGEAGLGKSRLMAEAKKGLPAEVHWIEGRAVSFGQTISYFPFIEIVKTDAGIGEDDGEAESWRKLEGRVRALIAEPQVPDVLPYVAALVGLSVRGELEGRVNYLDGEAMGHQIFRASRLIFEALARERPTVLVFEDFHWADQSSEALLTHLLPLVESVPLLLCCPTRPDPDTPGARFRATAAQEYPDRYTEIVLNQLTPAETAQLVHNLLAVELSPRLRQIFARGEGNPFFLEEVLRSLIDMGAFERDELTGRWQVGANIDEITIPDTIQGVIMARVDRLDEESKRVLRTASVIGRSFFYQVLRAMIDMNGGLDSRLAELEGRDLIRQKGLAVELEYIFKHALTREAVYGSILLRRRRELHARVAGCIESLFPDDLDEFYALLAYHYAQAEDWEKAKEYLFKAGDEAGKLAADTEALAHYRLALDAHTRLGERWDPFERAVLERKIGEALFRRGENDLALEHLQRALVDLGSVYPDTRFRVRLAIVRQLLRQVGHRVWSVLHLPRRKVEADAVVQERCRIYENMGWIHYFVDQEGLLLDVLLMTNVAERTGYTPGIVSGWTGLGFALDLVPMFGAAERYDWRAVELAPQTGHPASIGFSQFGLAFHEHRLGRFPTALEHYRLAAEAYLQAGELRKWAAGARQMGQIDLLAGRLVESVERCREVIRTGEDAGDHQARAWGLNQLGALLWRIGAPDEGARCLEEAIAVFEGIPDHGSVASASGDLARCYLLQGRAEEAAALIEGMNRLIAERKLRGFYSTEPSFASAEAALLALERATEDERPALLKPAQRACKVARKQAKLDRQALPAACRLEGVFHWLKGDEDEARTWWQRSIESAEQLGAAFEVGATTLEQGRRTGDPEQLARGDEFLAELSAARDAYAAAVDVPAEMPAA